MGLLSGLKGLFGGGSSGSNPFAGFSSLLSGLFGNGANGANAADTSAASGLQGLSSFGVTGGLDFLSQYIQYEFNRKLQHDAQDFTWEQDAYKHTREVEDLKRAGLNPILSAKFGGSALGAPGQNSVQQSPMGNALVNSAMYQKTQADIQNVKSQSAYYKALGDETSAKAVQENIEALRDMKEFSLFDTKDDKGILSIFNSSPPAIKGAARPVLSTGKAVSDTVGTIIKLVTDSYKTSRNNRYISDRGKRMNQKGESNRKQLNSIVDKAESIYRKNYK